jgi:hypothetical protein
VKVSELIKKLLEMPQDAEALVLADEDPATAARVKTFTPSTEYEEYTVGDKTYRVRSTVGMPYVKGDWPDLQEGVEVVVIGEWGWGVE